MTKKQLIEKLKDFPDDMDVFIEQTNVLYNVNLLEKAEIRKVCFSDEHLKAEVPVIVLTDEL